MAKTRKLVVISKTGGAASSTDPAPGVRGWNGGRPAAARRTARSERPSPVVDVGDDARQFRLEPLVAEWLLDLQVMGRSARTLTWYRAKMDTFTRQTGATTLDQLTAFTLKQHLADGQARELADNTIHGSFQVVRGFAAWAARENYPVDPSVLRVRAPKVAQKEPEAYNPAEVQVVLRAVAAGWGDMAVKLLLGTGMRLGELCALTLEDIEDDGAAVTLKVRRGKGAKFRRVPVSSRLRRELVRYLNRHRAQTNSDRLLVLNDGRPAEVRTVQELLKRVRRRVGFPVHAHGFRHTFATEYLRNGGEIERLRRILGHTTYVMVMRYVHLDKGDLCRDFDLRSPF